MSIYPWIVEDSKEILANYADMLNSLHYSLIQTLNKIRDYL